ncbi:MAG: type II toxin-antitoxin system VapC family toxin [Rhizobiaceae bacterium]|nr:type II toxin-antitoxin system VapC family toxin [Rhizobiaceae bacterium]
MVPTVVAESLKDFLREARIDIVPIDGAEAWLAIDAFERYGKGCGHPARLNLADCFSYASARTSGVGLLYKGEDFARTDLA